MRKKLLAGILLLAAGAVTGFYVNSLTLAKYTTINATCSLLNVAVERQMLTTDQVRELGTLTAKRLQGTQTAKIFQLSPQQIAAASASSDCSQFMVGMSRPAQ